VFSLVNSAVNITERRAAVPCCGAVAAERRRPPVSIDMSCPNGAQQQTRRTPLLRTNDGTDRRADRSIA